MISHYGTLTRLTEEFHRMFAGWRIEEIFSQESNELVVTLSHQSVEQSVIISCEQKNNFIFAREKYLRAKKNTIDVFPELLGGMVENISLHPQDRIVVWKFDNGKELWCALFGSKANIYIVNERQIITNAFIKSEAIIGKKFSIESKSPLGDTMTFPEFSTRLYQEPASNVFSTVKNVFPNIGSLLAKEICFRSHIPETTVVELLSSAQIDSLFQSGTNVLDEMQQSPARIYSRNTFPVEFAILSLQLYSGDGYEEKVYSGFNEAIRAFVTLKRRAGRFEEIHHSLISSLKSKIDKCSRTLNEIEKQKIQGSREKQYEGFAQLLLANLNVLQRGMKEIPLPDFLNPEQISTIVLDPRLSPVENAQRYFEKSKHAKKAEKELEKRKSVFEESKRRLEAILQHVLTIDSIETLKNFMKEKEQELKEFGITQFAEKQQDVERIPFRIFMVAGGFEVWAGKSSANNDLLTVHYSQPNDLWFHARGAGGSHVVLRVHGKNAAVPKEAILQTASIAAYYSKMRNAKNVPVAYCERKYVRKPKGVKEGTVMIDREKVIFVEPKLPAEQK